MRIVLLALIALLLAAPAADACARRDTGPRWVIVRAESDSEEGGLRSCDRRTGRDRILSAPTFTYGAPDYVPRGTRVDAWTQQGPRVAWIEVRADPATMTASIVALDVSGGPRRRVVVARTPVVTYVQPLGLTRLHSGSLAYSVWDDPAAPADTRRRLVVRRPEGRTRVALRGDIGRVDRDDRYTVRWASVTGGDAAGYLDFARPPRREGCPVRERFASTRWYGDVRVTRADYGVDLGVFRVCVRGSGRDPVFARDGDNETFGNGTTLKVIGADGTLLGTATSQFSRYDGCQYATVTVHDATNGRALGSERTGCDKAGQTAAFRRLLAAQRARS